MSADVIAKVREALESIADDDNVQLLGEEITGRKDDVALCVLCGATSDAIANVKHTDDCAYAIARAALALLDRVEREPVAWAVWGRIRASGSVVYRVKHVARSEQAARNFATLHEPDVFDMVVLPLFGLVPTEENDGA